jgi:non-heme Fe2+,alpha-ketoglutarate-dependent halogenase
MMRERGGGTPVRKGRRTMPKFLSDAQVAQYRAEGFLAPLDLYSGYEAAELTRRYKAVEDHTGAPPESRFRVKAHLPFPWLCDVVKHPRLLDAIEDIIGPDILCWGSTFFAKRPEDGRFISWHTDSFFYGTEPNDTITAWVAFTESDLVSGCVKFVPGSHIGEPAEHVLVPNPLNMSSNGQTVMGVDEDAAVDAILKPGQFSLHHESVVHGSLPNSSDHIRIGFSIHYCPPEVRETRFAGATAMVCRGTDRLGHWAPDPDPKVDYDADCIALMDETLAIFQKHTNAKIAAGGTR